MKRERTRQPSHPGVILRQYTNYYGLARVARACGVSRKHIYALLRGESNITVEMACRLATALGTSIEVWLSLQRNFDLFIAKRQNYACCAVSEIE